MRLRATALLTLALTIASGCGGPADRVWVTGKVVKGGARYSPPKDQVFSLTFIPLEHQDAEGKTVKGGDPYAAEVNASESTFEVPGPDRLGIPRGKYRVALTQQLQRPAFDAARQKSAGKRGKMPLQRDDDMLEGRYGPASSPIVVEIARSEEVTIDLDKVKPGEPAPSARAGTRAGGRDR